MEKDEEYTDQDQGLNSENENDREDPFEGPPMDED
jgi:hypothetical protein